jgi:dihydropteroate synthase
LLGSKPKAKQRKDKISSMRPIFHWNIGTRSLPLGKKTVVMGVLNVTPDSFSDGGLYFDAQKALEHALQLLNEGAEIIDIGGESTRPGVSVTASSGTSSSAYTTVTEEEEIQRVIPVISALKKARPECVVSIDTYKSSVARKAAEAGAEIVNDVSGFRWDLRMVKTLADLNCGAILMHSRGRPDEWHALPAPSDIVVQVKRELREWVDIALMAGMKRERIALDPGFGFGKRFEENYPLLKRFDEFHQLRYPLMVGISRKSFIGRAIAIEGKDAALGDRIFGTIAAETVVILKGAHIIRTHDVKAAVEAAKIADAAS